MKWNYLTRMKKFGLSAGVDVLVLNLLMNVGKGVRNQLKLPKRLKRNPF